MRYILFCLLILFPALCLADDYKNYHNELSDCYYSGKPFRGHVLSKEEFEKLHTLNWLTEEKVLKEANVTKDSMGRMDVAGLTNKINTEAIKEVKDKEGEVSKIAYNLTAQVVSAEIPE